MTEINPLAEGKQINRLRNHLVNGIHVTMLRHNCYYEYPIINHRNLNQDVLCNLGSRQIFCV